MDLKKIEMRKATRPQRWSKQQSMQSNDNSSRDLLGVRWLTIDLTHVNSFHNIMIIIPMYNHLNSIFWQQTKFFWKDNTYYLSMYIHVNNCIDRALVQFLLCPIISNIFATWIYYILFIIQLLSPLNRAFWS